MCASDKLDYWQASSTCPVRQVEFQINVEPSTKVLYYTSFSVCAHLCKIDLLFLYRQPVGKPNPALFNPFMPEVKSVASITAWLFW